MGVLLCTGTQAQTPAPGTAPGADYIPCTAMPEIMTLFKADHDALDRFYFVQYSPERGKRYQALCRQYLGQLQQIDFKGLPTGCRVDYILFKRDLNEEIHHYDVEAGDYQRMHDHWFPFADTLYRLEKERRRGKKPVSPQVAKAFITISASIGQLDAQLKADEHISVRDVRAARGIIEGLKYSASSVYKFYNGYDPDFTWWVPDTYKQLDSALGAYQQAFEDKLNNKALKMDSSGIVGNPIGRDEIIRQLQLEMIPYTPEELIDIAGKEFAWCDEEMKKASHDMGFGDDWKAALEKVKNSYVPAGDQP
jgi:hypothetical protein